MKDKTWKYSNKLIDELRKQGIGSYSMRHYDLRLNVDKIEGVEKYEAKNKR